MESVDVLSGIYRRENGERQLHKNPVHCGICIQLQNQFEQYPRNPFGLVREKAPDPKSQHVACFSEIPLHRLRRLVEARSEYGIVFRKDFVIHQGANPIMYAYKDHDVTAALKEIAKIAEKDPNHPIWRITPFVDAPGKYGNSSYFFEWEREWRKAGHFKFSENDVAFLIIPEKLHDAARGFFTMQRPRT